MLGDFLVTCFTMPVIMIGMPLLIRKILGEERDHDSERAITTISRNIFFTLPLVSGYVNLIRTSQIVDFSVPRASVLAKEVFLITLIMDSWFYWWHRALHTRFLYNFHRHHHSFRPTTTMSYVAMSLFEFVFENLMYFAAPPLIWRALGYTLGFWSWAVANIGLLIWASLFHSEKLRFSLAKFDINGPKEHHVHHRYGLKNGNYSLLFLHWDKLCGTYIEDK